MDKLPGAMFVVDIKREQQCRGGSPSFEDTRGGHCVDTNCDPDLVDYPVAGNDDAIRSVRMILGHDRTGDYSGPG